MRRDLRVSRRNFLAGTAGLLLPQIAMPSTPGCTLAYEQEEGPYYIDYEKLRQNVVEDKPGLPVKLRILLVDSRTCKPVENAAVDIWHCDASGVYSGFTAESPDGGRGGGGRGPGGPPGGFGRRGGPPPEFDPPPEFGSRGFGGGMFPPPGGRGPGPGRGRGPGGGNRQTDATRFLRGAQISNHKGLVDFATLYPGWYSGRAIHIHMKVHVGGAASDAGLYAGGHIAHTGQLFFPEDITTEVAKLQPYAKRLGVERTLQEEDGIFNSQHGSESIVKLERITRGTNEGGFVATATLGIDRNATPERVDGFPGRHSPEFP